MDYEKTIKLKHTEFIQIVDQKTGEVKKDYSKTKMGNPAMATVNKGHSYQKSYNKIWQKMIEAGLFTTEECGVAFRLGLMASPFNNVLPYNDETSISEFARIFGIDRRRMKPILQKLFKLGVYGEWKIHKHSKGECKSWIFNPYLFFNGTVIDKTILQMFQDTTVYKFV